MKLNLLRKAVEIIITVQQERLSKNLNFQLYMYNI